MAIPWQPLERGPVNPALLQGLRDVGDNVPDDEIQAWTNHLYDVIARKRGDGMVWLSIKRHDRRALRHWRHLQQIKNEICGPEREAVEIFPAESRLADTANQYHLWVFPEGVTLPIGFAEGLVTDDAQTERINESAESGESKNRQEPWEEGLTTGRLPQTPYLSDDQEKGLSRATRH